MSVNISRVLHAGYIFETPTTRILFDPIFESPFSRNCYSYPKTEFDLEKLKSISFSAIFISHYHDDHCSLESLHHLDRKTPIYIFCLHPELLKWIAALGFSSVIPIELGTPVVVKEFTITPTRALDEDVDCIFQIEAHGLKILNMVDAWMEDTTLSQLTQKSPWDVVLWPFQTFRELEILSPSRFDFSQKCEIPFEFTEQLKALNPRFVVPSSCQFRFEDFSWLNDVYFPVRYSDFADYVHKVIPQSSFLRIEPSETYTLTPTTLNKSTSLHWMKVCENPIVEYGLTADIKIPTLLQWAQNFDSEAPETEKHIAEFCRHDIFERFARFPFDNETYFSTPKIWRLTIYSALGASTDYFYQICQNKLTVTAPTEFVDWHSEIIDSRLLGALHEGESLSSLYMRINDKPEFLVSDFHFESIDVLWDPLLHILYTGQFGSYQKAQLQKILSTNAPH